MELFTFDKPIIKVKNLNKKFKSNHILKDLNFEIYQGEIISLLGLSGCGKSTLLNILCGFLNRDSGDIDYNFKESKKLIFSKIRKSENIRNLFGFASQNPSFYEELTVYDNLKFFGIMLSVPKLELEIQIEIILNKLNLISCKNSLGSSLSEGMKKRLDFGCSIIHNPKILIMDEPTSNLDYKLREELLEYILKINKLGMTIIFVSHYLEEVTKISNRVALLSNSKIETFVNDDIFKSQIKYKL